MRRCDVAVVGLGLMGSAALNALHALGIDAIGFEPLPPGSSQGSSHGSSRIFRRFNFESPHYTKLSDDALMGWGDLEAASGHTVLQPVSVLEAGWPGSPLVEASRQAALARNQADPLRSARDVNREYPAFALPDDWHVVVQDGGAILRSDIALAAMRALAADRIVAEAARIELGAADILIRTHGDTFSANKVILALGPWLPRIMPQFAPVIRVTRQVVGWFQPAQPALVAANRFPIFILDCGVDGLIYGFPDFEGRGVKAAPHNYGAEVGADAWGPPASDAELGSVSDALAKFIPAASGPIVERDVCLYTNTSPADRRPDGGGEFIIDRWQDDPRLIIASPCSGHGAKFAPAIGAILARLAVDPSYEPDSHFRLSRYSCFS
jgi:glycine/D-amino acid oxidase-like deaminating enzyme